MFDFEDIFLGFLGFLMGSIVLTFGLLVLIYIVGYFISIPQCTDFQKQTGRETKMTFWNGCLVNTPQGWIYGGNLIVNEPTKEK